LTLKPSDPCKIQVIIFAVELAGAGLLYAMNVNDLDFSPGRVKRLRFAAPTTVMLLIGLVQDPVKARFRGDIGSLIRQDGNDLPGRQAAAYSLW
jgi:hypothetical protein